MTELRTNTTLYINSQNALNSPIVLGFLRQKQRDISDLLERRVSDKRNEGGRRVVRIKN